MIQKTITAITFLWLSGNLVYGQAATGPLTIFIHIKQDTLGLLDIIDLELSLKNIGNDTQKVLPPLLEPQTINWLHYSDGAIEYSKNPDGPWNKYYQFRSARTESRGGLVEADYDNLSQGQEVFSGLIRIGPGRIYAENYRKIEGYVIESPGKFFLRANFRLLSWHHRPDTLYSKPIEVFFHDYQRNRYDHKAYKYLKTIPEADFIIRPQFDRTYGSDILWQYEPFAYVLATKHSKSMFAQWAYLFLADAQRKEMVIEDGKFKNEEAAVSAIRKMKAYKAKAKSYKNPVLDKRLEEVESMIYFSILHFVHKDDDEKMREDPVYKALIVDWYR